MDKIKQIISNVNIEIAIQISIAIGIVILFRISSSIVSRTIIRILRPKTKEKRDTRKNPFYLPLRIGFTYIGIYIALNILTETLQINTEILAIITKIVKVSMILFIAKAFGDGLEYKKGTFTNIKSKSGKEVDEATVKFTLRAIKILIYIFAGFVVISELGYNISGFITGLGISGVVLTLAAQDTAKSLIGGISIFIDRPFKVGDYIKVGDYEGTVEDIKFRSTSVRTVENSVLHVPNSEMSVSAIINYGEMEKRRYYAKLVLELDTKLEKVEEVKTQIEKMLKEKEEVIQDSVIVKFQEISDNGIDVSVIAYINRVNYREFLEIKEQINYAIMAILQSENVELAYNTQTIYVKKR